MRAPVRIKFPAGPVSIGPEAGIAYDRVRVDGFSEDGGFSTSLILGNVEYESLTGRAGIAASAPIAASTGFFARVNYVRQFEDQDNAFTVTAMGAPVSYRSDYDFGDRDYGEVAMGVTGTIGPVGVRAGAAADFAHDEMDAVSAYAGLTLPF